LWSIFQFHDPGGGLALVTFSPSRDSSSLQEIILHTLFESGASKIQDIERYISDDVERYGARLTDLEKKLVSAYRESVSSRFLSLEFFCLSLYQTAVEVLEDEGLFDEEDEEDTGALAMYVSFLLAARPFLTFTIT
jgi:transcriptional activator SPT7